MESGSRRLSVLITHYLRSLLRNSPGVTTSQKPVDPGEIADVVRDDRVASRRDCDLGDHVVVRVAEKRPPKEEDVLPTSTPQM
jgi:hypothetical protein